jgi:hypothetical protein
MVDFPADGNPVNQTQNPLPLIDRVVDGLFIGLAAPLHGVQILTPSEHRRGALS